LHTEIQNYTFKSLNFSVYKHEKTTAAVPQLECST